MKTNRLFFVFAALFVAAAVMFSCQKEEIVKFDDAIEGVMLKSVSAGDYFAYSENPICLGDEVTVTFDNTQEQNHSNFMMHVWGPDGSIWIGEDDDGEPDWFNLKDVFTGPSEGKITFTFTPDVAGEYRFRGQWVRTGNPATYPGESTGWQEADPVLLVEVCGCVTEMAGETECGTFKVVTGYDDVVEEDIVKTFTHKVVYTYTPEIDGFAKIQGGIAAKWTNYFAEYDEDVFEQNLVNDKAAVYSYSGDVNKCVTYTITVYWTTTNLHDDEPYIVDDWTTELSEYVVDDVTLVLFNKFKVDKMECDDDKEGYQIYPEL